MTQSISGLVSNLDTSSIIQQLVALEQQKVTLVAKGKDNDNVKLSTWAAIRTTTDSLKAAVTALQHPTDWTPLTATSSDTSSVTVTAGSGTLNGTLSFTVDSLASAGSYRSANVLGSTTTNVAADSAIFVASAGATIGFSSFASDNALATGTHDIKVTQSSSAATKLGTGALGATTTINPGDTIDLNVNGVGYTLDNIAAGTYNPDDLAAAIQDAADAKGAAIKVTIDPATNALKIASAREGSLATLQITGGTALANLNLTVDLAASTGTDGKVQVDGAAEQTFSQIDPGQTVVLNAAAGTITATFSGGLRAGDITGNNVSVGDGSLATVVANINAASAGVTATAVQVGQGAYRLQINANTTGVLGGPNIAASEFNNAVGSLVQLTAATDAKITVGSGAGAYSVTSQTNTITGVMPGVTLQLVNKTTNPVTVTVQRDVASLAAKVQALVDAANKVQSAVSTATHYDPDTKTASPLTGDMTAARLLNDVTQAMIDAVPWANPGAPGLAGVSIDKDGKFTFDSGKFTTAFNADPNGMMRAFTQGGAATDPSVTFVSAGDQARAGTYDVNITAAATQATTTGLDNIWPAVGGQVVNVRMGTKSISYTLQAGDTQAGVVQELNNRLTQAGMRIQATSAGTAIQLQTLQYGKAANFDVDWGVGSYTNIQGTDVQGTIDGKAAIGTGQQLAVPFDDPTLGGLALNITSNATGALGQFTYQPGIAQRAATIVSMATDSIDGYITSAETALKNDIKFIDDTTTSMQAHVDAYQQQLKDQFNTLETTLSALKAQGNALASAFNSSSSG